MILPRGTRSPVRLLHCLNYRTAEEVMLTLLSVQEFTVSLSKHGTASRLLQELTSPVTALTILFFFQCGIGRT
jgi:hypothetical protein